MSGAVVTKNYEWTVINGGKAANRKKCNLYSFEKKTNSNKKTGESSEVFAFKTKEEIKEMIDVFDKYIEDAPDDNKEQIAYRNKLLFLIGINVGIRASDLRTLKWSFFYNEDGTFKKAYTIFPKKTKNKPVRLHFNDTVELAIKKYVSIYPIDNLDSYIFMSRKGNSPICEASICRIIKDAATEAGIKQNIGSHSLRKTWGFWRWHDAKDSEKNTTLDILMVCFNHSSCSVTSKYIGITDDEIKDVFNSVNLGIEFI